MHVHDTYQWCLSLDFPGEYRYRGTRFPVPIGSLSVIHPGEVHASRDLADRRRPASFRVLYAAPRLLQEAAGSISERPSDVPFFADPVILNQKLAADFLAFHIATEAPVTRLEPDTRLLFLLAALLRDAGTGFSPPKTGHEPGAVNRVRDYLDAHYADNPSLADLAHLVDLSPFHIARVFRAEFGLPPHAYLIGVRICRAKELLAGGWPAARVATATGFFDQSHLTHHFKRLVGVSPGRYALRRKNVQDERQRTP
ncbi:MAG: AraC family transcriptional regulator [Chloroflexota bacterium]|nr:AraC family transcriptional regulator [Chloroflexota bacterium]